MENQIVYEARKWIGTKFLHHGRLRKNLHFEGGCDCLGLVIGVLHEIGVQIDFEDDKSYSRIIRNSILIDGCKKHLIEKQLMALNTGNIVIFKFRIKLPPQHLGIIGKINNRLTLIHSHSKIGKVVEHLLDDTWMNFLCAAFVIDV